MSQIEHTPFYILNPIQDILVTFMLPLKDTDKLIIRTTFFPRQLVVIEERQTKQQIGTTPTNEFCNKSLLT